MGNDFGHGNMPDVFKKRVKFTGAGALIRGQGLCYDRDRGTATDADGQRDKFVELPTLTNNNEFAGVTVNSYNANASGQWIEIYEPGSVCEVAIGVDTVVNSTHLTCVCSAGGVGLFTAGNALLKGRGSATALQTNASGSLGGSMAGGGVLSADGITLTDTGEFASAVVGDKVIIWSGEDDTTNEATPGTYTILTVTSDDVVVLSSAASDGGTMQVSYTVVSQARPTCLAKLHDGEETGMVQHIQGNQGAQTVTVGGTTIIGGGITPGADSTDTVADGTIIGQHKVFSLTGALTTNNFVATLTSGNVGMAEGVGGTVVAAAAVNTALATWTADAATDFLNLKWTGTVWLMEEQLGGVCA